MAQPSDAGALPEALRDFIVLTRVDEAAPFVAELFERKFAAPAPAAGHHMLALHRVAPQQLRVLGYANFLPFGDIMLVGGVCTDGEALRAMDATQREAVTAAGGIYLSLLRHAFARLADQCEAYFGYCGDARAEQVNLQAGFVRTVHPHLLVNFHKPLHEVMQRALLAKAAAIGPF